MEEEIEERLEQIYTGYIKVKFRDFCIYDVFLKLKGGDMIAVVFLYDAKLTMEGNIHNISMKIDNELIKLYKKCI